MHNDKSYTPSTFSFVLWFCVIGQMMLEKGGRSFVLKNCIYFNLKLRFIDIPDHQLFDLLYITRKLLFKSREL